MRNRATMLAAAMAACVFCASPAQAAGGNGMTWAKVLHDSNFGIDKVGCSNCNAYAGDTSCSVSLPILCIRNDNSPRPAYIANPSEFYDGWARGHITTTPPVQGITLTSLAVANQICAANFGAGWRMAEFHDGGGGWAFRAYGNVRNDLRYWVYINDQPANCWNP